MRRIRRWRSARKNTSCWVQKRSRHGLLAKTAPGTASSKPARNHAGSGGRGSTAEAPGSPGPGTITNRLSSCWNNTTSLLKVGCYVKRFLCSSGFQVLGTTSTTLRKMIYCVEDHPFPWSFKSSWYNIKGSKTWRCRRSGQFQDCCPTGFGMQSGRVIVNSCFWMTPGG